MASELEFGMSVMFRDAVQQSAVLELRTEADWRIFNDIKRDAHDKASKEISTYNKNRDSLIAAEKTKLIHEAGSVKHGHPTPFGLDRFNPNNIAKEAKRRVELGHQSRLMNIREEEATRYTDLSQSIRARDRLQNQVRDSFARATDRRTGQDRRGPARD